MMMVGDALSLHCDTRCKELIISYL